MKYGKSEQERKAEESLQCRKIVQEIINFGVTESQKLKIIHQKISLLKGSGMRLEV